MPQKGAHNAEFVKFQRQESTKPGSVSEEPKADMQLPREVIQQLRDVVFGFDTFYVTSTENYQANGVLFKGNLRGRSASDSYTRTAKRFQVNSTALHACTAGRFHLNSTALQTCTVQRVQVSTTASDTSTAKSFQENSTALHTGKRTAAVWHL